MEYETSILEGYLTQVTHLA